MKTQIASLLAVLLMASPLALALPVGTSAPDFEGTTSTGQKVSLAKLKADKKFVVLQWHNEGCPYVVAQYKAGNMQKLQKEWTDKGVVWLSVISSAAGKQGAVDAQGAEADVKTTGAHPTATILDTGSKIATAYGAQTTPHMMVIDPTGKLIYNGALDDTKTTDAKVAGTGKVNYVSAALSAAMAGKPVMVASTQPYGCGVKY